MIQSIILSIHSSTAFAPYRYYLPITSGAVMDLFLSRKANLLALLTITEAAAHAQRPFSSKSFSAATSPPWTK